GASLASGAGAMPLLQLTGSAPEDLFGASVASLGDVSGDGLADFAVAATRPDVADGAGRVTVHSGSDGALLFDLPAASGDDGVGAGMAAIEAAAGGAPELFVGSPLVGLEETGQLRAVSLDRLTLTSDRHRIEVDAGGTANFSIDAGEAVGGHFYVVLGTFSGTSPGLPSPVGALPINFDAYSLYSLTNPSELVSFNGFLDASGRTSAQVALAPGSPASLTQFQLHFGAFTVDFADPLLQTTAVSNAVPLGFDVDDCFATDPALDCNGNGVLDVCEIADGTAIDCDGDGRPDECDLGLPGMDEDDDGVLDSCRTVVYVDADALGPHDGTSWASAYANLAQAMTLAPAYAELWVAEGTYRPWGDASNDEASFVLRDGMALFGGFSGVELARDERDPALHPTVLSGDIGQDDGTPGGGVFENSWNVVSADESVGPTTRLEGFTLEAGNAKGISGCDVYNVFFRSCRGGGLYALGSPTVRDCIFRNNFGGHHGGAVFTLGTPTFVDCRFEGNNAIRGGGLYSDIGARPRLLNCVLRDNEALEGGGLYAIGSPADGFSLENCLVTGNRSIQDGAAAFMEGGSLTLLHCTLAYNTAGGQGGGVFGQGSATASVLNSILWGNEGVAATPLAKQLALLTPTATASCVEGGPAGLVGFANVAGPPQFVDPLGLDGIPGTADDDLRLLATSPCVDSGNGLLQPVDSLDLDLDGILDESLPLDLDRLQRVVDDPTAPNTGVPASGGGFIDMGPYERQ
ncbi:MAG: integrin alpha, partial [Planctomycetota bacterium]